MKKPLIALTATLGLLAFGPSYAQLDKAASETANAAEHKIDEKRAENEASKSGPVGKAVNKTKASYHKNRAKASATKAKKALKDAG